MGRDGGCDITSVDSIVRLVFRGSSFYDSSVITSVNSSHAEPAMSKLPPIAAPGHTIVGGLEVPQRAANTSDSGYKALPLVKRARLAQDDGAG